MVASLRGHRCRAAIPYEVILVDDGSTDGTREWLAGLGEPFRVVLNERNLGFGGGDKPRCRPWRGARSSRS